MLQGSSALSKFCTSLSKMLTIWHCVKVKQPYISSMSWVMLSYWIVAGNFSCNLRSFYHEYLCRLLLYFFSVFGALCILKKVYSFSSTFKNFFVGLAQT